MRHILLPITLSALSTAAYGQEANCEPCMKSLEYINVSEIFAVLLLIATIWLICMHRKEHKARMAAQEAAQEANKAKQEAVQAAKEANEAKQRAVQAAKEANEAKQQAIEAEQRAMLERDRANKANHLKVVFMENMSHGIRTPLNAIVGFNEVLTSEMADMISDEEKREFLVLIRKNADMLTGIINDILYLSKLDSSTCDTNFCQASINELAEAAMGTLSALATSQKNVAIELGDAGDLTIETDKELTQKVLAQLLDNAIKFTPEGGNITLSCRKTDDNTIEFAVTDTGSGVPEDQEEKIFERFYKADAFTQGSGLGLSICVEIARLLKGKLELDNTYKGGARFVFTHPINQPSHDNA